MAGHNLNKKRASAQVRRSPAVSPITIELNRLALTWREWLPQFLLIVGVTVWIYAPVFRGDWLLDDDWYYTKNPLLKSSLGLWKFWFSPGSWVEYYPINETVMWIQWQLWGRETLGYHLTGIILHLISALLVWKLLRKFDLKLAWLGGLIFAIHPVQVESVATMAELKNTLSLPPFLLAMCAWVDYDEHGKKRDYQMALGLFLVAMLCKISMAPFPAIMLLYAWWKRGRVSWNDVKACLPFLLVSVALGYLTVWAGVVYEATGHGQPDPVPLDGAVSRFVSVGLNFSYYFATCVLPVDLTPFHPQWTVDPHQLVQWLPWPIFAAVVYGCWIKRETWGRHVLLGLGFFVASLLPFVGFLNVSFMGFTWTLDHLLYIPLIGLIGVFTAGVGGMYRQLSKAGRMVECAGMIILVGLMTLQARAYATVFQNQGTTWSYVLRRDPDNWLAQNDFGAYLLDQGRYAEAVTHLTRVIQAKQKFGDAYYNMGIALGKMGRTAEAEEQYRTSLAITPKHVSSWLNLGVIKLQKGDLAEAEKPFRQALEISPDSLEASTDLAGVLIRSGRAPEALELYQQVVKADPSLVQAQYDLGNALLQLGRLPEAEVHLAAAVDLDPGVSQAHENLGAVLAQMGHLPESIEQFEAALRLTPDYQQARDNLAFALAQSGRFNEAIEQLKLALKANPDDKRASETMAKLEQIQLQQNASGSR